MAQDIEPETHLVAERETEYTGPVKITSLKFRGRTIQVVRPADPDRLLDDPLVRHWNERDDYMPYWAYLWPGALFLAEAVAREPWPLGTTLAPPLRALEIGCGVGLAGLVAVSRGLSVCFTDYDHAPCTSSVGVPRRMALIPPHTRPACWTGAIFRMKAIP